MCNYTGCRSPFFVGYVQLKNADVFGVKERFCNKKRRAENFRSRLVFVFIRFNFLFFLLRTDVRDPVRFSAASQEVSGAKRPTGVGIIRLAWQRGLAPRHRGRAKTPANQQVGAPSALLSFLEASAAKRPSLFSFLLPLLQTVGI